MICEAKEAKMLIAVYSLSVAVRDLHSYYAKCADLGRLKREGEREKKD